MTTPVEAQTQRFSLSPDGALLAVVHEGFEQQLLLIPMVGDAKSVRWLTGSEKAKLEAHWLGNRRLMVTTSDTREIPTTLIEAYAFDVDDRARPIPRLHADHMRGVRATTAVMSKSLSPRFLFGSEIGDSVRLVSRLPDQSNTVLISSHRDDESRLLRLDIVNGTHSEIERTDNVAHWVSLGRSGLMARWQQSDSAASIDWLQDMTVMSSLPITVDTQLVLPPPVPQSGLMLLEGNDPRELHQLEPLSVSPVGPLAMANEHLEVMIFGDSLAAIERDGRVLFFDEQARNASISVQRAIGEQVALLARSDQGQHYLLRSDRGEIYFYDATAQQVRKLAF